jgi:transcriptional regulator with XRE-family HTH domain
MPLGQRILDICKARGLSLSRACALADLRYSTLHSQIHNHRAIPFASVEKLANALDVPLSHFSDPSSTDAAPLQGASVTQTGVALSDMLSRQDTETGDSIKEINLEDVLDWLITNEGRLVNIDWLIEQVDLFHPAHEGDHMLRPFRIGSQSLAARYFRLLDNADYTNVVSKFDRTFRDELVAAHLEASRKRYAISDMAIDVMVDGTRVQGTYRRLLAPVKTMDGTPLILLYSKLTQLTGR